MISFKKTALKAAMAAAILTAGVNANASVTTFDFVGDFDMYDPTGALMWHDTTLTGTIYMDMASGGGTAQMQDSTKFFGQYWTAHNIEMSMNPDFSVNSRMLFDWNGNYNITVYTQFQLSPTANPAVFNVSTNDADGDGITGNAMLAGPFPGYSPAFSGVATATGEDPFGSIPNNHVAAVDPAAVPVPAAVWLFGSGLLGLMGVARRKKAA